MLPLLLHELLGDEQCECSSGYRVSDADRTLTRHDLHSRSAAIAQALVEQLAAPGRPVLVSASSDALLASAIAATSMIGAPAVPVPHGVVSARVEGAIRHLDPCAILHTDLDHRLLALSEELGIRRIDMLSLPNSAHALPIAHRSIDLDIALGMLTSGTTSSRAKTVGMPHHAIIGVCEAIARYLQVSEKDTIVMLPPPSFDYGLYQLFIAALRGAHVVIPTPAARRFPGDLWTLLEARQVTVLPLTPATARHHVGTWWRTSQEIRSVRVISFTGSSFPEELIGPLSDLFPNATVVPMYGITEAKRCTYLPSEDYPAKLPSVGIPIPNCRMRVVDENGNEVGANVPGEFEVESRSVMTGYLGDPELSSIRIIERAGTKRLLTGDIGYRDSCGFLFWTGRVDDIVKVADRRISLKEIEHAIVRVAGIANVAVVQLEDSSLAAFVVANSGSVTEASVRIGAAEVLGDPALVPRYISFIELMPLTTNGKVDYELLKGLRRSAQNDRSDA